LCNWLSDASFVFLDSTLVLSPSAQAVDVDFNGSVVLFTQGPEGHNAVKLFVLKHLKAHHKGQPSSSQTIVLNKSIGSIRLSFWGRTSVSFKYSGIRLLLFMCRLKDEDGQSHSLHSVSAFHFLYCVPHKESNTYPI